MGCCRGRGSSLGRSGKTIVSNATGLSRTTIYQGIKDLTYPIDSRTKVQTRIKGGGRKSLISLQPEIKDQLKKLIEDTTCGDPESPFMDV